MKKIINILKEAKKVINIVEWIYGKKKEPKSTIYSSKHGNLPRQESFGKRPKG